jgi:hypothetical protein
MRFSILTILTLATTTLFGQTIQKCDRTVLLWTSEKIGKLNQKEITDFLTDIWRRVSETILNIQNGVMNYFFPFWTNRADLTVKTIEKDEKRLEMEAILEDLSSPLLDPNIKDIISRVEKVKIKKELKDKIIERLKTADGKTN